MRAFIAVEIPEQIKRKIGKVAAQLKNCGAKVKWVEEKNLHFTLRFLGELNEAEIQQTSKKLKKIAETFEKFEIEVKGLGEFEQRVVWVGVGGGCESIKKLARGVETVKFVPHITLGRIKDKAGIKNLKEEIARFKNAKFGSFKVENLTLLKSTLTPGGSIYERIKIFNLKKED